MIANRKSEHNISSLPKVKCYGCGVCIDSCPENCIVMATDNEGFYYPQVNEDICTACRNCIATCPGFNNIDQDNGLPAPLIYGGYAADDAARFSSSSGGIFSLAARHILLKNGVVYGAVYDFQTMTVTHARATCEDDLQALRKSKYVQSDTTNIFPKVKRDLDAGMPVLFTGTPCQVAGLILFLTKDYENLLTCDLICHGVPSPGLFESHFTFVEETQSAPITDIDFRTKEKGWGGALNFFLKIKTETKDILTFAPLDAYYALFLANLSLRPCCYECKYANLDRVSDLTLGDFWGVKKHYPELFDGKGTSLILVNTDKGKQAIHLFKDFAAFSKIDTLDPMPINLVQPSFRPRFRDVIFQRMSLERWRQNRLWVHIIALWVIVYSKFLDLIKRVLKTQG